MVYAMVYAIGCFQYETSTIILFCHCFLLPEERQKLLSEGGGGGESGDEQPATLPSTQLPVTNPTPVFPVSYTEPPPEYTPLVVPKYQEYAGASGMGIPVQVQVEGRTVPATLVQEVRCSLL